MILPFLSIFFIISFIFVLKNNHNNGEKKKKDEKGPMMTTGFKVNCQTCIDKIQKLVLEFEGEMNFSADKQKDWVTVNGIRDDIESLGKTLNSPVEIMPFRKDEEGEKKDDKGSVTTTVFRFPVHCDGCIDQIQKMVLNFEGVTNVSVDMEKDLVIVNGTMDVKALTERLGWILMRKDRKDKKNEGEKGPETMMAFKVPQFEGVTDMSANIQKDLVTGIGTMDNIALTDYTRERLKRPVEVVAPPEKDNGGSDYRESDGDSSDGDGDRNKKNEGEKAGSRTRTTVFKVKLDCAGCERKTRKIISKFEGVTDMSTDIDKDLVTVTGTMDNIALTNYMKEKLRRRVEIVSWQSNEVGNGSDGSDNGNGDSDSSGSGGDKNKKKGNGGNGDSDGDDGDKGEGGGGCGKMKGFKMDCMGEPGFGYRYGYHAGFENGCPVGQLHMAQMSNSDNQNGKEDRQSNEVGNGNAHGSGIKDNNNGDGGGKMKGIKMNYMGQLSGLCDAGEQLHVAQMFCRENLNACSNIRSVVLV